MMKISDESSPSNDPQKLRKTIFYVIHAEILGKEAYYLIGQLLHAALAQGDESARRSIESYRFLLRFCRDVGG
ncbi:MAG: hypothetical protein NTX42_06175 [Methanothrix sp.]|nr:hypothetical protein [Methanothrix sp.]